MCDVVAVAKDNLDVPALEKRVSLPNSRWKSPERAGVVQELDIFACWYSQRRLEDDNERACPICRVHTVCTACVPHSVEIYRNKECHMECVC